METVSTMSRRLGGRIREVGLKGSGGDWYGPHMAAAAQAILQRIPFVDLLLEVRDARIPHTSIFELLGKVRCSYKHMIVLNKVDLADRPLTEEWLKHFKNHNYICYGNNSHNKEDIKKLLNIVQATIKEIKAGEHNYTATVMLVGIPNVGKSALANSMHQIGRIDAAEKGKLKHAIVSTQPGETKDISSYKIASCPNIYVLDTPGILYPEITDDVSISKLALTGAITDSLAGECELARFFLGVFNSEEVYKKWDNFSDVVGTWNLDSKGKPFVGSDICQRKRRQYSSDHTQDFIVRDVRRTLFKTRSSFSGYLGEGNEMERLITTQFADLHEAFRVSTKLGEEGCKAVAAKLLNLYRTGRLGRYTLDLVSGKE